MEDCCKGSLLRHFCCLLVLTQLLTWVSTQEFQVLGPRDPIVAAPGGVAVLPCSLSLAMSVEDMELRWFRRRFSDAVFVYWNQQEQKEEQMAEYSRRTSLVKDQLSQGKAAVRIHPVRVSDSGIYVCFFKRGSFSGEAILERKVAAIGSVPDVYTKGPEDHGVGVVCKTSGWYPKPQVQWRDSRGQTLPVSSETHTEGDEGLFSMETSLVVRDSSLAHVTCSIFNPILGEEKAVAMFIPGCFLRRERSARLQMKRERKNLLKVKEVVQKTRDEEHRTMEEALKMKDWSKEQFQAWPVTLDPKSSHPTLTISQDRKSVAWKDASHCLDGLFSVLGSEGISSGRRYWEVKIENALKSYWTLGVCREGVEKKDWYGQRPNKGFWTAGCDCDEYLALTDTGRASLSLGNPPHHVGVFVDYSEGSNSFYNMSDRSHIYAFHEASFSGTLFPYFSLKTADVTMTVIS